MPKMIVTADRLPYGKTAYRKGDEIDVEDRHVQLFLKIGKTQWPEGALSNASDLPVDVMSRSSRREPATEVDEPAEVEDDTMATKAMKAMKAEAVKEDEAPKPQTYQHRAMVAETPKAPEPKKPGRRGRPRKSRS